MILQSVIIVYVYVASFCCATTVWLEGVFVSFAAVARLSVQWRNIIFTAVDFIFFQRNGRRVLAVWRKVVLTAVWKCSFTATLCQCRVLLRIFLLWLYNSLCRVLAFSTNSFHLLLSWTRVFQFGTFDVAACNIYISFKSTMFAVLYGRHTVSTGFGWLYRSFPSRFTIVP